MTNFNEYKEILETKEVTIHNLLKYFKKNTIDYDEFGNIFINFNKETKNLPILVAHTDNVLGDNKRIPVFSIDQKKIFCANGTGIGFDDKAGIIGIIELWNRIPESNNKFRIMFTANEETGGIGAGKIDKEKYKGANYIIELDRRGSNDIIQTSGATRLCSDEFAKLWVEKGFKIETGTFTDLNQFKPKAKSTEMCNLSIGYYNPHSQNEYLEIKHFEKTIERVQEFILENENTTFEDKTKDEVYKSNYSNTYKNFYNNYQKNEFGTTFGRCECCNKEAWLEYDEKTQMILCEDCMEDANEFYNN